MKVIQEDTLMTPNRYTGTLSSSMDPNDALTKFLLPTLARKTSDYYYTTVAASSISDDQSVEEAIDVSYDGKYTYANGANIPNADPVNITQTFTNTVKTGSLTISKELNGNMDEDSAHSYGFQVIFSKVFGGNSSEETYKASYTLIAEDGTKTTETATTGIIILKPNQKATIFGIPVGTTYQIKEISTDGSDVSDGSVVNKIQTTYVAHTEEESITSPVYDATNDTAGITVDKSSRTITGVIPCSIVDKLYGSETNEFTEVNVSVAFTNQFGALSITKKIAGDVNNSSYYGTGDNEKTYVFKVTDQDGKEYSGQYLEYTYKFDNGQNSVTQTKKGTTNGEIILKEGQKAEIGGIKLSDSSKLQYTIKEQVEDTDIFFVEALKVTTGIGSAITADNTSITTQKFDSSNPTFDVIYSNRYSNAYITIEKYIDKLYNEKEAEKEYSDDLTYQELTNAKQSFIFNVKQYKTLEATEAGNDSYEKSFDVVVSMGAITAELSEIDKETGSDGVKYSYKASTTIKVLGNRYYRIEEDTDWSWKYLLKDAKFKDNNTNPKSEIKEKVVILKSYLDDKNEMKDKIIPVAKFYNSLNPDKEDIEGDTDNITNKIKKK